MAKKSTPAKKSTAKKATTPAKKSKGGFVVLHNQALNKFHFCPRPDYEQAKSQPGYDWTEKTSFATESECQLYIYSHGQQ